MKKLAGIFILLLSTLCFYHNSTGQSKEEQKKYKHFSDSIASKIDFDKKNDSVAFYRNESGFRYMENLDSLLRHIKKNKGAEITKETKTKIGKPTDYSAINRLLSSKPVTILLWLIVISFALFIIYKFIYKGGVFNRRSRSKTSQEVIPNEYEDVSQFHKLLTQQENAKNYNEAVRFLFLITLNKMSDKRLLHFSAEKTNRDYLMELTDPFINKEFAALVKTFEYCWYGKFNITEERYLFIKKDFNEFNNKI